MERPAPVTPVPVPEALAAVTAVRRGLLALGMPRCSACMLLPASLAEVARARPDLVVAIGEFASPADWALREDLLWPRGIHVSRSSVPALALLVDGEAVASRAGGGPAHAVDAWLAEHLGPAADPLPDRLTAAEEDALTAIAGHMGRQRGVKAARADWRG